jgi:hypothetical protein
MKKVDEWVAPEDVAEVMLALVADEQISQVLGKRDSEEAAIKRDNFGSQQGKSQRCAAFQ